MPKTLFGDVNMDGRIDITDAVLLNKMAAGAVEANQSQRLNGDVNGNGEIDSADGLILFMFVIQQINTLPYQAEI